MSNSSPHSQPEGALFFFLLVTCIIAQEIARLILMRAYYLFVIIIISFFIFLPSHIKAFSFFQTQSSAVSSYNSQGYNVMPSPKAKTVKRQTLSSRVWSVIGAVMVGSTGVLFGAFIAWFTMHKKRKAFNIYYEQINQAQQHYVEMLKSNKINREEAVKNFEHELKLIQEQAEFTAAQKKLDQEQLTAIINKVKRIMDELTSS